MGAQLAIKQKAKPAAGLRSLAAGSLRTLVVSFSTIPS